jgi:hypothetical protein
MVVVHGKDTDSKDARVSLDQNFYYRYENINNFEFSTKNAGECFDNVLIF